MFTQDDLQILASRGISEDKIKEQLNSFATGFPYLKLSASAAIDNGILAVDDTLAKKYLAEWNEYLAQNHRIVKFVPASGAASRMFKNLFEFLDAEYDAPTTDFEKKFFDNIERFAFYDALNDACVVLYGNTIDGLMEEGNYKEVVAALLGEDGLNYGALPKGLLQFHAYEDQVRTAMEEHLAEGAMYAGNAERDVNVHFTVSHDHLPLFKDLVEQVRPEYESMYNVKYHITFSEQKPSTDTIAADMDNNPFRDSDGSLLFRPGGHGALIENLNDLKSDIVFIKNIDNVVPDYLKAETVYWKQVIAGVLVEVQKQVFGYLRLLDSHKYSHDDLEEIIRFTRHTLGCNISGLKDLEDTELHIYLRKKLNRPIRVCGVVKNVGEPGGGPFLAYNPDGSVSLQILESSQIDQNNPEYMKMFTQGTHFNPVDLVCAVRNYKGEKFNLPDFVDPATGFISYKSKDGKELKALELPGLWNGAMSDWNTIMVEVPLTTFNPVKTVNDLLRSQHQPSA